MGTPQSCARERRTSCLRLSLGMSRTVVSQPGHSLLQNSIPDEEGLVCVQSKRKKINWTPNAWLYSTSHQTGFSTSEAFSMPKVQQDWISHTCPFLGLDIPHLKEFQHRECQCNHCSIGTVCDHLQSCTQHAGATMGAHVHILTDLPAAALHQGRMQN